MLHISYEVEGHTGYYIRLIHSFTGCILSACSDPAIPNIDFTSIQPSVAASNGETVLDGSITFACYTGYAFAVQYSARLLTFQCLHAIGFTLPGWSGYASCIPSWFYF